MLVLKQTIPQKKALILSFLKLDSLRAWHYQEGTTPYENLCLPHAELCFLWQGGVAPSWYCHGIRLSAFKKPSNSIIHILKLLTQKFQFQFKKLKRSWKPLIYAFLTEAGASDFQCFYYLFVFFPKDVDGSRHKNLGKIWVWFILLIFINSQFNFAFMWKFYFSFGKYHCL